MDAEERMVTQAAMTKAKNPAGHVWVYRCANRVHGCNSRPGLSRTPPSCSNLVKALPWFHTVREKLLDPAYSGFFLKFDATRKGNYSVPQCDNNYNPPICSDFCASPTLAAPCFRLPTF